MMKMKKMIENLHHLLSFLHVCWPTTRDITLILVFAKPPAVK